MKWQSCARRDIEDAGDRLDAIDHSLVVGGDLRGVLGARVGHGQEEGLHVVGVQPEIDAGEIPEAVNGEARAGKQRKRQRKLADDQYPAQAMAAGAGCRTPALLESFTGIDARGIPGGKTAEEHARQC